MPAHPATLSRPTLTFLYRLDVPELVTMLHDLRPSTRFPIPAPPPKRVLIQTIRRELAKLGMLVPPATVNVRIIAYDVIDGSVNNQQTLRSFELTEGGYWWYRCLAPGVTDNRMPVHFLRAQVHGLPRGLHVDTGADHGQDRIEINDRNGDPWGRIEWGIKP